MKEIRCPKCKSVFTVDEADYASIVEQVRTVEFERELTRRVGELEKRQMAEREAAGLREQRKFELSLEKKEKELSELRVRLQQSDDRLRIAVLEEQKSADAKIRQSAEALEKAKTDLLMAKAKAELEMKSMVEDHAGEVRRLKEERDYYKDMKARMSTKMIGESLEVHCATEFNKIRVMSYPSAYFDKDNDASGGSKGDFIFRDYIDGEEYISIMFEMKNEADTTATKHRNEDFFAKLDKDRRDKECEYAVLVSLLESDSEYYNDGIVDVSYRYPKMFVIRPQFFLAVIALLTQASRKSVEYRRQLELARRQSVDVTNFENKMMAFRDKFSRHYELATRKFDAAVEEIDKTIKSLQKMKENLISSGNYLRLAGNDTEDLSIKKLTRGNPTMKAMFAEARNASDGASGVEEKE